MQISCNSPISSTGQTTPAKTMTGVRVAVGTSGSENRSAATESTGRPDERATQVDLPQQHRDQLLPIPAVVARLRPALNISDIRHHSGRAGAAETRQAQLAIEVRVVQAAPSVRDPSPGRPTGSPDSRPRWQRRRNRIATLPA